MREIYRLQGTISGGFFSGIDDEYVDQVLSEYGVTIAYMESGERFVTMIPEVNPVYSEATIRCGGCATVISYDEAEEAIKKACKVIGYLKKETH